MRIWKNAPQKTEDPCVCWMCCSYRCGYSAFETGQKYFHNVDPRTVLKYLKLHGTPIRHKGAKV